MIVFITTGYGKNVIGGADLWCNNFIENVLPLVNEDYKIIIDGRPLIKEFGAIYTYENEKEVDRILKECDKIIFLHHSYKPNPIIKNYLHKTYLTFVHAFIPDMLGLNSDYENIMTKVDWEWQKEILDNSDNIVWIGYEDDTIHKHYPTTKTITNYYEWKYDYKRMLEGSKTNSDYHRFIEFDYHFHYKFFEGNFQIFHGCYTKEPFGYAIFDAVDNGKVPIIHTDWMKHIDYKYRANSKGEFHQRYLELQENSFEEVNEEFSKLRDGLTKYTNKQNWIKQILEVI